MAKRLILSSPRADLPVSDLRHIPHARSSSRSFRARKRSKNDRFEQLTLEVGAVSRPGIQRVPRSINRADLRLEGTDIPDGIHTSPSRMSSVAQRYFERGHNQNQSCNDIMDVNSMYTMASEDQIRHDTSDDLPFSLNPHNSQTSTRHLTQDYIDKEDVLHTGIEYVNQIASSDLGFAYDVREHDHYTSHVDMSLDHELPERYQTAKPDTSYSMTSTTGVILAHHGPSPDSDCIDIAHDMMSDFQYMTTPAKASFRDFSSGRAALYRESDLREVVDIDEGHNLSELPKNIAPYGESGLYRPLVETDALSLLSPTDVQTRSLESGTI